MTEEKNTQETEKDNVEESKNTIKVDEAGTLRKKISVTIPESSIKEKQDEMFGEVKESAQIPGFRVGYAPRKLIEKRFGKELAEEIRNSLVGESIGDAIEQADLQAISEPDIDLASIEMPESGDLEFSFEIEIHPDIELPEMKNVKITKEVKPVDDQYVSEVINNLLESRAKYEKTEEASIEGDTIIAAAKITGEDVEFENPRIQTRVAPSVIEGIPLPDLADDLKGKKVEDVITIEKTCPDTHPTEEWQNKDLKIELVIKEIQRKDVPELTDETAAEMGFGSVAELKEYLTTDMVSRVEEEAQRGMREQVAKYLVENTDFELPEEFTKRHTADALNRRKLELMQYGMPKDKIEENIATLQDSVGKETIESLKLSLIINKIAETEEVEVNPSMVNSKIAQMALQYGKRPEKFKQELVNSGAINQVAVSVLEEEIINDIIKNADIEEKAPEESSDEEKPKKAKKAAKKKTAKKKTAKEGG